THDPEMLLQTEFCGELLDAATQFRTSCIEPLHHSKLLVALECCETCCQGVRLRSVSGGKKEYALPGMIEPAELHDLPLASERRDGKTICHGLAPGREVRCHAI